MKHEQRSRYLTREGILERLSDAEVASVATAETAERLLDGDEYIDLTHLEQGVQRWQRDATPMGRVLPRKAIQEKTWQSVIEELATLESAAQNSRV